MARERLNAALEILCTLADTPGQPLASPSAVNQTNTGSSGHEPERINRVLSMFKAAKQTTPAEYRRQFLAAGSPGQDAATHLTERSPSLQRMRKSSSGKIREARAR